MESEDFSLWQAVLLALVFSAAPAFAQQPTPSPAPPPAPIRVRVDRVSVSVIVTDAKGQFVESLHREDFHVFDDGAEQPITDFATVQEPAQVLLLVESGPAVYILESGHLLAAYELLNGLSAGDRVAIAGYADRPVQVLDFTADKNRAAGALGELRFNVGFGQLNLSASLNAVLDGLEPVPGKKTVVLLSTGLDTSPASAQETLLARLKTGDVRVLAVALGGELRETKPGRKKKGAPDKAAAIEEGFAEADAWLRTITEAAGGRVYFPKNPTEFAAAYSEIAQLVRHEYSLGFAPATRDGKVHELEVRVTGAAAGSPANVAPAYRVDHRRAYVAPAPQTP